MVELDLRVQPLAPGDAPGDHQLAARVDVGLEPAVPGNERQQRENREGQSRGEPLLLPASRLLPPDSLRIPPVQEKMATRNPVVRALASAASRVWFPATL